MINSQDSFVTSDESKLLLSLLRKEQLSEEQWEQFANGHTKGENSEKRSKNLRNKKKLLVNCLFFRVICSNHEWIAHVTLFQRVMRVISLICSCQFVVKRDKSNLLTAILFKRVMRVIQSLSLEWQEQITLSLSLKWAILKERAKSEEQKSKFPTLGFKSWNPCSTTQCK